MRRRAPLRRTPFKRSASTQLDPRLREAVMARDGGCVARGVGGVRCGFGLHVHHVRPKGRGGPDELDNLIVLCHEHHHWVHHVSPRQARSLGLLV